MSQVSGNPKIRLMYLVSTFINTCTCISHLYKNLMFGINIARTIFFCLSKLYIVIIEGFGGKRALGFLLKSELCRKRSKFCMQFC